MRLPRRSISFWSVVIHETSLPQCVRQNGSRGLPERKNFPYGHDHLAACLRNNNETAARNFEEQIERYCLAEIGGPGL
jgi:hypothetical protein